jgi:DNA-binding beta-propeller fold protein YncE
VSLVDAVKLTEVARIPTSKKIVHGIAYSPDGRLAYVSSESIGTDPGSVDVIDLSRRKLVGSVSIPGQPTGIAVLQIQSPNARR